MTIADLLKISRIKIKLRTLTARQEAVLFLVYLSVAPLDIGDVARDLQLSVPVITRAADTLEDDYRFIRRTPNKEDARKVFISITPKGRKFVESLEAAS